MQTRAEERIYVELWGTPEIEPRPLDLGILQQAPAQGPPQPAAPLLLKVPVYDDYYVAAPTPRTPNHTGAPVQHRLAKLDTIKGENGERLDDFVYQVEEF